MNESFLAAPPINEKIKLFGYSVQERKKFNLNANRKCLIEPRWSLIIVVLLWFFSYCVAHLFFDESITWLKFVNLSATLSFHKQIQCECFLFYSVLLPLANILSRGLKNTMKINKNKCMPTFSNRFFLKTILHILRCRSVV